MECFIFPISTLFCLFFVFAATSYSPVPSERYTLHHVVILVRHGDRIQITKNLSYNFPANNMTLFWQSKLPSEETLRSLGKYATPILDDPAASYDSLKKRLYSGWDYSQFPYGQLTEYGVQQLVEVGSKLRQRYKNILIKDIDDNLYCRSTNICRTILSLRSLLKGFFSTEHNTSSSSATAVTAPPTLPPRKLPPIFSRIKARETMYPHADGPCYAMSKRRVDLIRGSYNNATNLPVYLDALKVKLTLKFGIPVDHISWLTWLNLMEIMICYETYNVTLPEGISHTDVEQTIDFVTWVWGTLYRDVELVQFAVGRFIDEMVMDIRSLVEVAHHRSSRSADCKKQTLESPSLRARRRKLQNLAAGSGSSSSSNKDLEMQLEERAKLNLSIKYPTASSKLVVYSGHDATLVPLLVIFGIYNDTWPSYGSHLTLEFATRRPPNGGASHTALPLPDCGHEVAAGSSGGNQGSVSLSEEFVRVVYNDEVMRVEGCEDMWCSYRTLLDILKKYSMSRVDYQSKCMNSKIARTSS